MTNRGKASTNRQANNNNNNNNKSQNDDDNCSIICYKDSNDGHVGVIRIRQQLVCSACNLLRGTLTSYYKHSTDNCHRINVKKLCDENRFVPSVYDQAFNLAYQNNFNYQSDKFHFLYKHINEEPDTSCQEIESSETDKMEINNTQEKTTPRKRRNLQVTLIFQDKTYTQIGIANAQIREQLLQDMIKDRADDIAALPMEIYYSNKKIVPDDIHYNAQKGSVIKITTVKDQSQAMLKEQQQEPFENGQISSTEYSREDNGVEQNTAMTTHEISTKENIDFNDDIVCKNILNDILRDVYSKTDEFKREQRFLYDLARRNFKKRHTFFCDLCNKYLPSEEDCSIHLNDSEHLEKLLHYETEFLPWRKAMQISIITGKSVKEIMDKTNYDNYKSIMAHHLTPTILGRGRFCCAYCEVICPDQWSLEKHLHSFEHKEKQTSVDHKELIVPYANSINFPIIYKFNGISQLSEIPDDIRNRYHWRHVTRAQLDDDINLFIQNFPFDTFEENSTVQNLKKPNNNNNNNTQQQQGRRYGFNQARGGHFQTSATNRRIVNKRPFPTTIPPSKRFRPDLNNSFPGANRGPGPMRNYEMEQYNYNRIGPYNNSNNNNNNNNHWPSQYPNNQQQQQQQPRQEFFERSNFELRSLVTDNKGYYGDRSSYPMPRGNNYNQNRQTNFNGSGGGRGYDNQQSFIHTGRQTVADYHPEQNPAPLVGLPNRSHHRANTGPINERIHHIPNSLPHPQQQQRQSLPPMGPIHHQNQNSFGGYGANNNNNNNNNNNTNAPYFPSPVNQQTNSVGTNNPSVRSYADHRSSSGPSINSNRLPMYPSLLNTQNPVVPQARTFDEFGLESLAHNSSNPYGQSRGPSFRNEEPHYNNFGHQNQMEPTSQASWRGTSRGGNNVRGRGRGHGNVASSVPSTKQPGATFSFSSSSSNNNNNKNNGFSMRGRGGGRNVRNFGSRR